MAKGNRKRNTNKPAPPKPVVCKTLTTQQELLANYPVRTLNNNDVARFKELVTLSNNVSGLLKQCVDTDMSIVKGTETADAMLKGKIKGAAMQKVTANLFLPLHDMTDVARKIKGEVGTLKEANIISKGQLSQRYDEYLDSMRNLNSILTQLLVQAQSTEISKIHGDRKVKSSKEAEQVIFEKEVAKLSKEDKEYINSIKAKIDKKASEKKK